MKAGDLDDYKIHSLDETGGHEPPPTPFSQMFARAERAERQLEQAREALRDCRPVIAHALYGGSPGDALRYVDRAIVRALAATEAPEHTG